MSDKTEDEGRRLGAVRNPDEPRRTRSASLDHIAQVARDRFKVPMAAVSLVEDGRLFFAGRAGLAVDSVDSNGAMCSETVRLDDVLVIEDASVDAHYAASPLVVGAPFVRFYAGAPIILANGVHVGSMCILDTVPRSFNLGQRVLLKHMAVAAKEECERLASTFHRPAGPITTPT